MPLPSSGLWAASARRGASARNDGAGGRASTTGRPRVRSTELKEALVFSAPDEGEKAAAAERSSRDEQARRGSADLFFSLEVTSGIEPPKRRHETYVFGVPLTSLNFFEVDP